MANNIIKYNDKFFIKSTKVQVFPCAYRGGRTVDISSNLSTSTTPKRISFQPTSRSFNEENWTSTNYGDGVKDSFLVSTSTTTDDETEIKCSIGGYSFILNLTADDLLFLAGGTGGTLNAQSTEKSRYFTISTHAQSLEDFTVTSDVTISHKTKILASRLDSSKLDILDKAITGDLGIDTVDNDGTKFVFTGLSIEDSVNAATGTHYLAVNKLIDGTPSWLPEAYRVQNILTTSTGLNSIQLADTDDLTTELKETSTWKATGEQAMAFGYQSTASGKNASTFGIKTSASGESAMATGNTTSASGNNSVAFGYKTQATGKNAVAYGTNTKATADNSVATGKYTEASTNNQTVIGAYNAASDATFVIGNGTTTTKRSNVLTVSNAGEMILANGSNMENKLYVGSTEGGTGEIHVGSDVFNVESTGDVDLRKTLKVGSKNAEEFIFDPDAQKLILKSSSVQTGDLAIGESESSYKAKISANTGTVELASNSAELLMNANANKNYFKVTSDAKSNSGSVTTDKNVSIDNTLAVNGATTLRNTLAVASDVTITGHETISQYATIEGNLTAKGNVALGKDGKVITITNGKEASSTTVDIAGNTIIAGATTKVQDKNKQLISEFTSKTVTIKPATTIENSLNTKDITSSGNVTVSQGSLAIQQGNLTVAGTTALTGDLTAGNINNTNTTSDTLTVGETIYNSGQTRDHILDVAKTLTSVLGGGNLANYITEKKSRFNNIILDNTDSLHLIKSLYGSDTGTIANSYYLSKNQFNVIPGNNAKLKIDNTVAELKSPSITITAPTKFKLTGNKSDIITVDNDSVVMHDFNVGSSSGTSISSSSITANNIAVNNSLVASALSVEGKNTDGSSSIAFKVEGNSIYNYWPIFMQEKTGSYGQTQPTATLTTSGDLTVQNLRVINTINGGTINADTIKTNLVTGSVKVNGNMTVGGTITTNNCLVGWYKEVEFKTAQGLALSDGGKHDMNTMLMSRSSINSIVGLTYDADKPSLSGTFILQGMLSISFNSSNVAGYSSYSKQTSIPVTFMVGYSSDTKTATGTPWFATADVSAICSSSYADGNSDQANWTVIMGCNLNFKDSIGIVINNDSSNPAYNRLAIGVLSGRQSTKYADQYVIASNRVYPSYAYLYLTSKTFIPQE